MIDPDRALELVLEHARPLDPARVSISSAAQRILAEPILADRDQPPFDRAMMDGFAVRTEDAGKKVKVVDEVAAGGVPRQAVQTGHAIAVLTGAPCPDGTETVVPIEDARIEDTEANGPCVHLPSHLKAGRHVAAQGSECAQHSTVVPPGTSVTPIVASVMASFGRTDVLVVPRARASVIITGNETIAPEEVPQGGQIRDSNGTMLGGFLSQAGADVVSTTRAPDQLQDIVRALQEAERARGDIVVLTGGVSVGTYDLVPNALEQWGATIVLHKVKQKPGKPFLFATFGRRLVFALPGNPLSAHLGVHRYISPALRVMTGRQAQASIDRGHLTAPIPATGGRTRFLLARAKILASGRRSITMLPSRGSADIFGAASANAYIRVDPGATLGLEEEISFEWIDSSDA